MPYIIAPKDIDSKHDILLLNVFLYKKLYVNITTTIIKLAAYPGFIKLLYSSILLPSLTFMVIKLSTVDTI